MAEILAARLRLSSCLAVLLMVPLGLAGCTSIADVSDYRFDCQPGDEGKERCACTQEGTCNEGLRCFVPGVCVRPEEPTAGTSAPAPSR